MIRASVLAYHSARFCIVDGLLRRMCSTLSKIKVTSTDDDEFLRISFRYGNLPPSANLINIKALKDQQISEALTNIRQMVNVQKKKETIRRVVSSKYSTSSLLGLQLSEDEELEITLLHSDKVVDNDVKNIDAWAQGSVLKIGELTYEVNYNTPTVSALTLPDYILADCVLRPHFLFECASAEDSIFSWYRSAEEGEPDGQGETGNNTIWQKIHEGMLYTTSSEDIGHKLKVVCVPKMGNISGPSNTVVSKNTVEAGPESFPFQERQAYTKDFVDSDCIRCVSYNILANCYVESRRFPYASRKARDIYYRKQVLIKEIIGYNSDIICLQEVQDRVYKYDLVPVLKKVGFDEFYACKGGKRYEGVAVFYRTAKFNMLDQQRVYLNALLKNKDVFDQVVKKVSGNFKDMSKLLAQDTTLSVLLLEHANNPNHKIVVANTHLYSNKDKPEVRLLQSALCASYLERFIDNLEFKNTSKIGLIFCGDFNSLPGSAAYQFLVDGSFTCSSGRQNSNGKQDTTLRHNFSLRSACGTPPYTNYTEDFYGCLDYIFYGDQDFTVSEVVPMPNHEDVTRHTALPSEIFPSDHLPLVCTLKWKSWHEEC